MSNNHMTTCNVNNCFSNFEGKCMCLTSAKFEGQCPFYKTQTENDNQRKTVNERLKRLGLLKMFKSKYGGANYEI